MFKYTSCGCVIWFYLSLYIIKRILIDQLRRMKLNRIILMKQNRRRISPDKTCNHTEHCKYIVHYNYNCLINIICFVNIIYIYISTSRYFWPILTLPSPLAVTLCHTFRDPPEVRHTSRTPPNFSRPSTKNPDKSPRYKFSLNCLRGFLSGGFVRGSFVWKILSGVAFVRSPFCQNTYVTTES